MMKYLILLFVFIIPSEVFTQEVISAVVMMDENNEPCIGAYIIVKGITERVTYTDLDGKFEIEQLPGDTILKVMYVGYMNVEFKLPLKKNLIKLIQVTLFDSPVIIKARPESSEPITVQQLDFNAQPAVTYTSTDEILNTVPGVYMQSGSPNTKRLTIRGNGNRSSFASSGVKIYLDNIPLHDGQGESAIEDFGTHLISKAQVIKGPTGPSYGSGLSGAVVLNSDNGLYGQENNVVSYNEVGPYGLFRTASTLELYSKPTAVNHKLKIHQSYLHSDGYRDNNIVDRSNISLSYRYRNGDHTIRLLANRVDLDAQIPSALGRSDFLENPRKAAFIWDRSNGYEDYSRTLAGLTYDYKLSNASDISTTVYGKDFSSLELRPFNTIAEDLSTQGARVKLKYGISIQNNLLQITVGSDYQREEYQFTFFETLDSLQGAYISDGSAIRNSSNTYANIKYIVNESWVLALGAEYAHLGISDDVNYGAGQIFPVASVSKRVGSGRLYLKAGQGANFPTAGDLNNTTVDLKPEIGWNIETGMKGYYSEYKLGYRLSYYRMQVRDQFVQRFFNTQELITINGGSSTLSGLEGSLRKKWLRDQDFVPDLETTISGSYNFHTFDEFVDGNSDFSGNELTGTPPFQLRANTTYSDKKWTITADVQHVASFAMNDANTSYSDSYTVANALIQYKLINNSDWEVMLGTKLLNILNEEYASMISVNAGSFGGAEPRYYYGAPPSQLVGNILIKYKW